MTQEFNWSFDPALAARSKHAMDCYIHGMSKMLEELADFARRRADADVAAWNKFAKSKTPADVVACQQDFVKLAVTHYVDEANRLSHRMIDLTNEVMAAAEAPSKAA